MGGESVISDSSVLIVFARAERLEVLTQAVGRVAITPDVRDEAIDAARDLPDARALARALDRGRIVEVPIALGRVGAVARRYPNLGRGEASVIAAALARQETVVLMDERAARRAAALEGLRPVGSLGVLARARRAGTVRSNADLARILKDLLGAGLWVSPEVIEAFWESVGPRS